MDYETREYLASNFADTIREIRENKWKPFSQAAADIELDPYLALARVLVRMLEERLEGTA